MSVDKQPDNQESITGNRETYGRGEHPNSKANLMSVGQFQLLTKLCQRIETLCLEHYRTILLFE